MGTFSWIAIRSQRGHLAQLQAWNAFRSFQIQMRIQDDDSEEDSDEDSDGDLEEDSEED